MWYFSCELLVFLDCSTYLALFHGQRLFGRAMSVRLDRWNDVKHQKIPHMLPSGLESIGMGLGAGGKPLQNIGQIASMYTLSCQCICSCSLSCFSIS